MEIVSVVIWLFFKMIYIFYFVYLIRITIEDAGLEEEPPQQRNNHEFKLVRAALLTAGAFWCWSNLGSFLIGCFICLIIVVILEAESITKPEEDYSELYSNIFITVRCILGVLWLCSLYNLLLFTFLICMFIFVNRGSKQQHSGSSTTAPVNKENPSNITLKSSADHQGDVKTTDNPPTTTDDVQGDKDGVVARGNPPTITENRDQEVRVAQGNPPTKENHDHDQEVEFAPYSSSSSSVDSGSVSSFVRVIIGRNKMNGGGVQKIGNVSINLNFFRIGSISSLRDLFK